MEDGVLSPPLRRFLVWMARNGIQYSDALRFGMDGVVSGAGVRALRDLHHGELIATIPKAACLTLLTTAARDAIERARLGGGLGLTVALMYERSKGKGSKWYRYLKTLPRQESVPFLWSEEEIDGLLLGTELHKALKEDKLLMKEDWEENIAPLTKEDPLEFPAQDFTFESYLAAKSLVSSRSFEIDAEHGYGMVPLADLFNHKTDAEDVHFMLNASDSDDDDNGLIIDDGLANGDCREISSDKSVLEMVMVKDVAAGSEIFNTYGQLGNAALLHRYGFTEPNNPHDIVNLDMDCVLEVLLSRFQKKRVRKRGRVWRKAGFSGCESQGSEYFEISASGKPQIELLLLLFVIQSRARDCKALEDAAAKVKGRVKKATKALGWRKETHCHPTKKRRLESVESRLERWLLNSTVINLLLLVIGKRDELYGITFGKEEQALGECRQHTKELHAARLRIGERRILRDCKQELLNMKANQC
ncbi:N-lysine methyltransferase setd6 [Selaginella moellendorffii]|uniref:N-lysine methyltransferase setd6 n=1 Tax=Selaginella moellendorffii TaxID=88036 RepID=UPI000D1D0505|nr:N-lysine methyltransferase setd6 [Selaginella moellendorffii]|eukprot:XP_002977945.2 N-lysine methyltransferase setd6 [Selaginella moellendorffii]